jgi:hypothetical protein
MGRKKDTPMPMCLTKFHYLTLSDGREYFQRAKMIPIFLFSFWIPVFKNVTQMARS